MDVTLEKTKDLEGYIVVKIQEADYADRVKKSLRKSARPVRFPDSAKAISIWYSSANVLAQK